MAKDNDTIPSSDEAGGDSPEPSSAEVVVAYVARRRMKMFAITDDEIDSLSSQGRQRTAYFSGASFLLSLAIAIWLGVEIEAGVEFTDLPPRIQVMKTYGVPLLMWLSLFFVVMGGISWWRVRNVIKRIRTESRWQQENT